MRDLLWMHLTRELFQLIVVLLSAICAAEDASGAHVGFVSGRARVAAYSTDVRSHIGMRSINTVSGQVNSIIFSNINYCYHIG